MCPDPPFETGMVNFSQIGYFEHDTMVVVFRCSNFSVQIKLNISAGCGIKQETIIYGE